MPTLVAVVLGACLSQAVACAGDGQDGEGGGETTSGRRVSFATQVAPPASTSFVNEEGWSIEVRRALVSIGALHYFSGEPIEGAADARLLPGPSGPLEWLGSALVGTAHAHPGHYAEGDARGEMLQATSVDVAGGSTAIAAGDGVTGLIRSARFTWGSPPAGPLAAELGDAVVRLEGRAEREGEERWFVLTARADQLPGDDVAVDGCIFDRAEVEGDGTVTVTIDPTVWVAGADFEEAPEGAEGAPELVPDGIQPSSSFLRGLAEGAAYRFTFTPN